MQILIIGVGKLHLKMLIFVEYFFYFFGDCIKQYEMTTIENGSHLRSNHY